jgi:hypothetical protein
VALVAASSSSFFVMSRRPVRCSCCWLEGTKKARVFERERERGIERGRFVCTRLLRPLR